MLTTEEVSHLLRKLISRIRRHHFNESALSTTINGADIRTAQQQLGHADVKTTEIYTHVLKQGAYGVKSPLSRIWRN